MMKGNDKRTFNIKADKAIQNDSTSPIRKLKIKSDHSTAFGRTTNTDKKKSSSPMKNIKIAKKVVEEINSGNLPRINSKGGNADKSPIKILHKFKIVKSKNNYTTKLESKPPVIETNGNVSTSLVQNNLMTDNQTREKEIARKLKIKFREKDKLLKAKNEEIDFLKKQLEMTNFFDLQKEIRNLKEDNIKISDLYTRLLTSAQLNSQRNNNSGELESLNNVIKGQQETISSLQKHNDQLLYEKSEKLKEKKQKLKKIKKDIEEKDKQIENLRSSQIVSIDESRVYIASNENGEKLEKLEIELIEKENELNHLRNNHLIDLNEKNLQILNLQTEFNDRIDSLVSQIEKNSLILNDKTQEVSELLLQLDKKNDEISFLNEKLQKLEDEIRSKKSPRQIEKEEENETTKEDIDEINLLLLKTFEAGKIYYEELEHRVFPVYPEENIQVTDDHIEKITNNLMNIMNSQCESNRIQLSLYIKNVVNVFCYNYEQLRAYFLDAMSNYTNYTEENFVILNEQLNRILRPHMKIVRDEFKTKDFHNSGLISAKNLSSLLTKLNLQEFITSELENYMIFLMKRNIDEYTSIRELKYANVISILTEEDSDKYRKIAKRLSEEYVDKTRNILSEIAGYLYALNLTTRTYFLSKQALLIEENGNCYNAMHLKTFADILREEIKIELNERDLSNLFYLLKNHSNTHDIKIIDVDKLTAEMNEFGIKEKSEEIVVTETGELNDNNRETESKKNFNEKEFVSRNSRADNTSYKSLKNGNGHNHETEVFVVENGIINIEGDFEIRKKNKMLETFVSLGGQKIEANSDLNEDEEVVENEGLVEKEVFECHDVLVVDGDLLEKEEIVKDSEELNVKNEVNENQEVNENENLDEVKEKQEEVNENREEVNEKQEEVNENREEKEIHANESHELYGKYEIQKSLEGITVLFLLKEYLQSSNIDFERFIFLLSSKMVLRENERYVDFSDLLDYLIEKQIIHTKHVKIDSVQEFLIENLIKIDEIKEIVEAREVNPKQENQEIMENNESKEESQNQDKENEKKEESQNQDKIIDKQEIIDNQENNENKEIIDKQEIIENQENNENKEESQNQEINEHKEESQNHEDLEEQHEYIDSTPKSIEGITVLILLKEYLQSSNIDFEKFIFLLSPKMLLRENERYVDFSDFLDYLHDRQIINTKQVRTDSVQEFLIENLIKIDAIKEIVEVRATDMKIEEEVEKVARQSQIFTDGVLDNVMKSVSSAASLKSKGNRRQSHDVKLSSELKNIAIDKRRGTADTTAKNTIEQFRAREPTEDLNGSPLEENGNELEIVNEANEIQETVANEDGNLVGENDEKIENANKTEANEEIEIIKRRSFDDKNGSLNVNDAEEINNQEAPNEINQEEKELEVVQANEPFNEEDNISEVKTVATKNTEKDSKRHQSVIVKKINHADKHVTTLDEAVKGSGLHSDRKKGGVNKI